MVLLYYNPMGPPSYMRSVVDRNVVMRRIPVCVYVYICMCVCVRARAYVYTQVKAFSQDDESS